MHWFRIRIRWRAHGCEENPAAQACGVHNTRLVCGVPEIVALGANRRRLTADAMAKTPTPSKATPRAAANDAFKEVQDVNEKIMR